MPKHHTKLKRGTKAYTKAKREHDAVVKRKSVRVKPRKRSSYSAQ